MKYSTTYLVAIIAIIFTITACVPSKKYNELLEREKTCAKDLAKYKKIVGIVFAKNDKLFIFGLIWANLGTFSPIWAQ